MIAVHLVVPAGWDDPMRPSGGNVYDQRLGQGLQGEGWPVVVHPVPGPWPAADQTAQRLLGRALAGLADGALVVVDGLVGCGVPSVLVPASRRLRLVVLVHLPLGAGPPEPTDPGAAQREGAVLAAARAVLTTSEWTRRQLLRHYRLAPDRVHVATPGVDTAPAAQVRVEGSALLCVAAVTRQKGHDLLLTALTELADLGWDCACVGSLDREPGYLDALRVRARVAGLADRISWTGPRTGTSLDEAYATSDLLVLASRGETYGMVVTEALARGLPVLATDVGGVSEALGRTDDGRRPGLLVPPEDPDALASALRRWLGDADLRRELRSAAGRRRSSLAGWDVTTGRVARVLAQVAA